MSEFFAKINYRIVTIVSFIFSILEIFALVAFQVIKVTWWILLPIFLFSKAKPMYRYWMRIKYGLTLQWILLEITLPPDVLKTPKAMENVLTGLHGVWTELSFRDKWIKGEYLDQFSLELVGKGGELHFYIRCQAKQRNFVESKIYAQYPDTRIEEVSDYMDEIPPDVPNEDYDFWGADFVLTKSNWVYPLRTYIDFEDIEEERRLDPLAQLGEMISTMWEGEYMLIQLIISPVLTEVKGKVEAERDKLMGRKKVKPKGFLAEVGEFIADTLGVMIFGEEVPNRTDQEQQEESDIQRLTPGERDLIADIERKAGQISFLTNIRGIYLARKDVMHREHIAGMHGFFRQFTHQMSNGLRPAAGTFPSSNLYFLKKQRNYIRKRRLITAYRYRFFAFLKPPFVLNVEELATIFHFPGQIVKSPSLIRTPTKSASPPKGLPT